MERDRIHQIAVAEDRKLAATNLEEEDMQRIMVFYFIVIERINC
tara:strand:- start:532 stop:663 length:132 start_codon:yes stop_codon:yes gene_type:complete